ncbi:aldolase catalytic domain-containing protein [uncultured Selenomonas sp.]|uniref:aldolase catalytic domain-containing protein n=1 Tax=uncultured Selenomonas sp. TaxID=159275 RepID=UPI00258916D8|nr:aldolase catalytic domain-containing protein [uncultured Selenomonas sp.]
MAKRELLDCTLRDGGYVNDWEFGHDKIHEIFRRLVSSGVEFIEIGFLDERRSYDPDRTIFPDTQSANKLYQGLDKGNATILAMIDYGTCGIEHLQPASETFIDGIRVIFKEHLMYEALDFCKQVQDLGYKVFAQMVSVTTYTDDKLKIYAEECNKLHPFATSMVDTYGLLDSEHLMHIFGILDTNLLPDIKEGFHAHNNFQLGFANARAFLESDTKRDILADGTLYGMGKSAGNAPLELLMMYMNDKQGRNYDMSQVLEAIDNVILDIYNKQYWGYNLLFYISAATQCHPNYVRYFMGKKTLSVSQIADLLNSLKKEKQLLYDAKYAEQMYLDYQNVACDDKKVITVLRKIFQGQDVLLVGPGKNIKRQKTKVRDYIVEHRPLTVAVNYAPQDIKVDYIFLTKSKRYTQLMNDLEGSVNENVDIIATSNVTKTAGNFRYVLKYESLIDRDTEIIDNSLVMLIKAMKEMGVRQVDLAGFDGYSKSEDNYFDISREYGFVKEKADYLNKYVRDFLNSINDSVMIKFITRSHYMD